MLSMNLIRIIKGVLQNNLLLKAGLGFGLRTSDLENRGSAGEWMCLQKVEEGEEHRLSKSHFPDLSYSLSHLVLEE